ncbi:MAG TPA: 50S ribosomal protein L9 [Actinobacteria bacterium]|jgi:large subunit ribosomal protein L9|nr:50S ribosomal protein L9 [Actinomycetota bacterium]
MKLILNQEVDGLGAPGDIVEVKDGYGRNYLVPRNLAFQWTKGAEKQITQIKRARDARAIRDAAHANEVKNQLEGLDVKLPARVGANNKLFGSINVGDIADAVRANGGPLLEKRSITLASPIKTAGKHKVQVKLHPEVSASVTIDVVAA